MSIHYTLTPSNPEAHIFSVQLQVPSPDPAGQLLTLPNWIPGSYMIRDFARNILSISASSEGKSVPLSKTDKSSWQAPAGLRNLVVEYQVYAWELSVRAAHLDTTHGFFNGTSLFLAVEGSEHQPCLLELVRPSGEAYAAWGVATSMKKQQQSADDFSVYETADYDELIDHPVEMGCFERLEFEACGVPHELVLTGQYTTDNTRLVEDLKLICEAQIRFFGEPAPVDRYVFLVMVVGSGYGGLEHRASTSLLITRDHLPAPGTPQHVGRYDDKYISFLGLCSHEYFHTWNVKRIKPATFIPYQLKAESHTELLWFFEGVTSYYDDLFLVRCGLLDHQHYLELLAKTITRVYRGPGRHKQSVADSSFDAWTRFYKQDENAPNAIVSYYAKGALVALCLDSLIRMHSKGRYSLDDLMLELWQHWLNADSESGSGSEGFPVGVTQQQIESIASRLAGCDLGAFFKLAVFGTEDLDLQESLDRVGVRLDWKVAKSVNDNGGFKVTGTEESTAQKTLTLGMRCTRSEAGLKVDTVFEGGAAQLAGIAAGDLLIALEGLSVLNTPMDEMLCRYQAGTKLTVHAFRHEYLMEFTIRPEPAADDTCWLSLVDDAESDVRFRDWLSTSAPS